MDFYYYSGNRRVGPISEDELIELANEGTITKETIVEIGGKRYRADKIQGLLPTVSESHVVNPSEDTQPVGPATADPVPVDRFVYIQARHLLFWARVLHVIALLVIMLCSFAFIIGIIALFDEKFATIIQIGALFVLPVSASAFIIGLLFEIIACACFYWVALNGHLRRCEVDPENWPEES